MPKDPATVGSVMADLSKKLGLRIGSMSEVVDEVRGLTTGNLAIDYCTGVGGLPAGRITELYGQPSAGKSTTALQAAAALQQRIITDGSDERILYLDFEHAMDGDYAAALGLDVEHPSFILAQPDWLEDGALISEMALSTGKVRLSIWDSVAEMTPKELEFGVRTNAMERARLMNSLLQRHNSLLHAHDCAGVFLNHLTEGIQMGGTRPGMPPPETSPGGKALKFYASLRMSYKQIGNVKGKAADALSGEATEQVIATNVKVKVTKNKVGIPFREAVVRVRLGKGFDNLWSALQILVAHKVIPVTTAHQYYFDTADLSHGDMVRTASGRPHLRFEQGVLRFAQERPAWATQVIDRATQVIEEYGAAQHQATVTDTDEVFGDIDLDAVAG